ncbi:MFS transporter [Pedobacter lithocola]|nr:MFS transporter [Pedobacter petrophilus]
MKNEKFPFIALLALTTAAFSAILAELLPAGVILDMAKDLGEPPSSIGNLVSYYALGTVMTAIPGALWTAGIARKPLLLMVVSGFFLSNLITAYSQNYVLTAGIRILAGGFGGLLWPLMAGYATRMVNKKDIGRAIALVMGGSTVALSVGLPFCAFLGKLIGWRFTFGALAGLMVLIFIWIILSVPKLKNDPASIRPSFNILKIPGVGLVTAATFLTSLAIYVSYTYLYPIQLYNGIPGGAGLALLLFGGGAVIGIFMTGRLIDRYLRITLLSSLCLSAISLLAISVFGQTYPVFFVAVVCWGVSFGGLPSLFQTATINAIKKSPELGSSLTVTVYNIGVFSGAFTGGLILDFAGPEPVTWASFVLLFLVLILVFIGHRFAFPNRKAALNK